MMPLAIRGAGGKDGGGGGTELADTVRSTQIADILDLISEGECVGLTNGLQSIYLDGVPLQAADGTFNFTDVQVAVVLGTQGQASIAGADGVQNELAVGVPVLFAAPVVRTVTNAAVDTVRVTIAVPQLSTLDPESGDLKGATFTWSIEVQSNGGGYVEVMREVVREKTMSRWPIAKTLRLTGPAPWDIRVKRLTSDSANANISNAFQWASYAEIQSLKLRHPNSAMVRTRVNAQQFARIPVRGFDWMGIKVQVPVNYDPMTRVYTGVWDGTFKMAWTDNPAWVYHSVVRHERYGLGRYITAGDTLKWELYTIGRYCDGMVPDGRGGTEPRFRCGLILATREQAYKVLTDLAAIFRGMTYWMNTDVTVTQDAPADPVAIFTPANVIAGKFSYAGSSNSKRHSSVIVWFNNLSERGKLVPEVVTDPALEARLGVRPLELSPLGVWSRGQAQRIGKWALLSEQTAGKTVTHRVGLDGVLVPPGKVFEVADPNEAGERLAGRVSAATTTQVTIDAAVTLAAGESYLLSAMVQDPADAAKLLLQKRAVSTAAGTTNVLTVAAPFGSAPAPQSVWLLQSENVAATQWRCLSLTEVKGTNEFEMTGLEHTPEKYALIEQGIAFETRPISRIAIVPPAPASVAFTETVYKVGSIARSRMTVSWPVPAQGLTYLLSWRLNSGPWTDLPATSSNTVDIDALAVGALDVSVRSRNALGNNSAPLKGTVTVLGDQVPASDVAGFTATVVQGGVKFVWMPAPDDLYLTTTLQIAGVTIFEGAASNWTWAWPPLGTYTVTAKHYTTSLKPSLNPASAVVVVDAAVLVQWEGISGPGKPPDTLNWDFTQGTDGWTGITSVQPDASASGGKYGVVNLPALGLSTRPIAVETARVYEVRVRARRSSGSTGEFYAGVQCLAADGSSIINNLGYSFPYTAALAVALPNDGQWHSYSGFITAVEPVFPFGGGNGRKFFPGTVKASPVVFPYGAWTGELQIDYLTIDDVTSARAAIDAAASAQAAADAANRELLVIAADDVLSAGEKPPVILDYSVIANEQGGIDAQAAAYGISAERTAYDVACAALTTYLNALTAPTAWNNTSGDTTIIRTTFLGMFAAVYAARQALLNRIAAVAGTLATWSGVAARPQNLSNLTGRENLGANLLNAANWVIGSSGDQTGGGLTQWFANPTSPGGVNQIALSPSPDGSLRPCWYAGSGSGVPSGPEGGIGTTTQLGVDCNKPYRFACWISVTGVLDGYIYLGIGGDQVDDIPSGAMNSNPYFHALPRSTLVAGRWYLFTGHVLPAGYAGTQLQLSGVYDGTTGQKVFNGADYRWHAGQNATTLRTFQYYTGGAGRAAFFSGPRFDLLDGSEPSIAALMADAVLQRANSAFGAAQNAQAAANAALISADAANTGLQVIAADSVLSAGEKPAVMLDNTVIVAEQAGIDAQATNYLVTSEKATYDAACSALAAYLASLTAPTAWNDPGGNTTIVSATFLSKFAAVYAARQAVLDKVAANAKARLGALALLDQADTAALAANAASEMYVVSDAVGVGYSNAG